MQLPLTTFRGLYKPPGIPRINWLHPAASALRSCLLFDGMQVYDLCGYYDPTTILTGGVLGVPTRLNSLVGRYVDFNTAAMQMPQQFSGAMSCVTLCMRTATPNGGSFAAIAAVVGTMTATVQTGFFIQLGNAFGNANSLYCQCLTTGTNTGNVLVWVNGAAYSGNNPVTGLTLSNNTWYCVGFTGDAVPVGSANVTFGAFPGAVQFGMIGGGVSLNYLFNRVLPPGIIGPLTADPMSLMIWPDDDLLALDMVGIIAAATFRSRSQMIA